MVLGLVNTKEELEMLEDILLTLSVAKGEGLLDIFLENDALIENGWEPQKYYDIIENLLDAEVLLISEIKSLCSTCNRPILKDWRRCPIDGTTVT